MPALPVSMHSRIGLAALARLQDSAIAEHLRILELSDSEEVFLLRVDKLPALGIIASADDLSPQAGGRFDGIFITDLVLVTPALDRNAGVSPTWRCDLVHAARLALRGSAIPYWTLTDSGGQLTDGVARTLRGPLPTQVLQHGATVLKTSIPIAWRTGLDPDLEFEE